MMTKVDSRLVYNRLVSAENPQSFPVKSIEKEDLLHCRPDLAERIENLRPDEMEYIADKMSDGLQEAYWLVMGIVLDAYLGGEYTEDDESDDTESL